MTFFKNYQINTRDWYGWEKCKEIYDIFWGLEWKMENTEVNIKIFWCSLFFLFSLLPKKIQEISKKSEILEKCSTSKSKFDWRCRIQDRSIGSQIGHGLGPDNSNLDWSIQGTGIEYKMESIYSVSYHYQYSGSWVT